MSSAEAFSITGMSDRLPIRIPTRGAAMVSPCVRRMRRPFYESAAPYSPCALVYAGSPSND